MARGPFVWRGIDAILLPSGTIRNQAGVDLLYGAAQYAFGLIQTPSGTNPSAETTFDSLTLTAAGLSITGNATTDTIAFSLAMAAIGSSANANGATLASGTLTLQPASASFGGVVTTGTQTFAGSKTFSSAPTLSSLTAGSVPYIGTGGLLSEERSNLMYDDVLNSLGLNIGASPAQPSAALDVRSGASYTVGAPGAVTITANSTAPFMVATQTATEINVTSEEIASGDVVIDSVAFSNVGSGSFTQTNATPSATGQSYRTLNSTLWTTNFGSGTSTPTDDSGLGGNYDVEVTVSSLPSSADGYVLALTVDGTTYYQGIVTTGTYTFTSMDSTSPPVSGTLPFQSAGGTRNYRARTRALSPFTSTTYYSGAYDYVFSEPASGSYYLILHQNIALPAGNGSTVTAAVFYGANDGSTTFTNSFEVGSLGDTYEGPSYWGTVFTAAATQAPTQWGILGTGQTIRFRVRPKQNIRTFSDLYANNVTLSNNLTIPNTSTYYYLETSVASVPAYTAPDAAVSTWDYGFEKSSNNGSTYPFYTSVSVAAGFSTGVVKYDDGFSAYTSGTATSSPQTFIPAAVYFKATSGNTNPFSSTAGFELPAIYDSNAGTYSGLEIRGGGARIGSLSGFSGVFNIGGTGQIALINQTTQQQYAYFSSTVSQIGSSSFPQTFIVPGAAFGGGLLYVAGSSNKVTIGSTTGAGMFNVVGSTSSSQIAMTVRQGSGATGDIFQILDSSSNQGTRFDSDFKQKNRRGKATLGSHFYSVGGLTSQSISAVGNVGTGEDNLKSFTCQANELGTDGDQIEFEAGGTFAAADVAATKRLKVKFGGTTIFDSGAVVVAVATVWSLRGFAVRTSSTAVRYSVFMNVGNMALAFTYASEGAVTGLTLSNTNTLQFTGECSSATNNEVTQQSLITKWYGAP